MPKAYGWHNIESSKRDLITMKTIIIAIILAASAVSWLYVLVAANQITQ